MEKINVHSLYNLFKKNIHKKPYQIISTMKSLAISTNDYSNFYSSATNLFHRKTFKLPHENNYPILKSNQTKYISLKSQLNTYSFHDKKYEKKDLVLPTKKTKIKKVLSDIKPEKNNKKKKKNINFFICEKNYGGKYNKLFENFINKKIKYSRNKKRQPPDFYRNLSSFKNIYPVDEIKNPEERIKDFFMFLNTIFIQDNYNNLKYEENEIFGHKEDILQYIKDEFNYYYKKEKEIDKKSFLYHSLKTKDYGNVELFLKSARIDIIDESIKNNIIKTSINIPFTLMLLIYIINFDQINQVIFFLLNKINIKEKSNIISDEESKNIFIDFLSKIKYEDNNIQFNLIKKNYERYLAKIFFLEKIQEVSETIRYNYFLSDFYKNQDIIKIIDNTNNKIYSSLNYINKKKIIFNTNINNYKLKLISQNSKSYKIKFDMPEISIIFKEYEKQLNHHINKELFLYLYQNNFMDWDFYVLHYLFCQKNFRIFLGKTLSLKNNLKIFLSKKKVNLENKKSVISSKNTNISEKPIKIFTSSFIKDSYKEYFLISHYSSGINITENDIEFIFYCLNENNLDICKFKSYTLFVFINNINKPIIYEFNFNFKQMRILFFRNHFENFDIFLKRLLFIKDDLINLDYSYFNSFYSMTNKEIYEFFYKLNQNNKEIIIKKDNLKINDIVLKIKDPHIEVISNDKKTQKEFTVNQYHIELPKAFLDILVEKEPPEWIKIIEEKKILLEFKKYIKYEESRVKKKKRNSIIKGKRRDFQSAFMQFLKISSASVIENK